MEQADKRRPTPEQASWLHSFLGVDISQYADEAEAGIAQAGHTVAEGASAAMGVVEEKAGEAGHAIAHGAQVVKDEAVHVAHEAGEAIEEGIRKAVAFMKEVGGVVEALLTELKHLAGIAKQDMGHCPAQFIGIATATTIAITAGVTCVGAVFASATPAAPAAIPAFLTSGLGLLTALGGLAAAVMSFDDCIASAIETKKKEAEQKALTQQSQQDRQKEDNNYQLILQELKKLYQPA